MRREKRREEREETRDTRQRQPRRLEGNAGKWAGTSPGGDSRVRQGSGAGAGAGADMYCRYVDAGAGADRCMHADACMQVGRRVQMQGDGCRCREM